jgi:two-component system response regulator LytT
LNRQFIVNHSAIANIQITHKGRLQVNLLPPAKEEVLVSIDRATAFKEWLGK